MSFSTDPTYDGRVRDALTSRAGAMDYELYRADATPVDDDDTAIRGMERTPVSALFFSAANVEAVQQGLRWRVFVDSNRTHIISKQSDVELRVVMRSIFLQEALNDPFDAQAQVRELNGKVLAYCVPRILTEIGIYMRYQRDISSLPVPMERGQIATSKGSRVLETTRFF